jgi:hypothetical protein
LAHLSVSPWTCGPGHHRAHGSLAGGTRWSAPPNPRHARRGGNDMWVPHIKQVSRNITPTRQHMNPSRMCCVPARWTPLLPALLRTRVTRCLYYTVVRGPFCRIHPAPRNNLPCMSWWICRLSPHRRPGRSELATQPTPYPPRLAHYWLRRWDQIHPA